MSGVGQILHSQRTEPRTCIVRRETSEQRERWSRSGGESEVKGVRKEKVR